MDPVTNVVNPPAASPTPPAIPTPLPSGSPASPASPEVGGVKPEPTTGAPATGAGTEPAAKTVPIEALHEERTKRQALDAQLSQLKAVLGDKFTVDANGQIVATTATPAPAQTPPDHARIQEEVEKAWNDDPKKAVRMEQMLALNWYDQLHWALEDQKEYLNGKYADYKTYEKDINKYIRSLPMDQRATPGAVELAYLVVRGKNNNVNLDDMRKQWEAEYMRKLQAGDAAAGIAGGTFAAPPSSGQAKPTEEQAKAAAAMGMKLEDYMRHV